ncbi:PAS domain S-box protein [Methanocella sp. MCL-LM]|uniref:PAS domain-containing protein n=1 Tax=Methanocella sp. MCL-LM TaxID=3412035 RepID=UPI003C77BAAD
MRDLSELGTFAAEAIKNDMVSFIAWQRDGEIITVNPQFYRLTGRGPQFVEREVWPGNFTTLESKAHILAGMDEQDMGREAHRQEETIVRSDRVHLPVELIIHRYQPDGSPVPIYFAFITDITERKRSISALTENEELFRVLSETALAAVLLVQNNRFIYVNPKALEMIGYSSDDLQDMYYWDIIHPDFRKEVKEYGDLLLHGQSLPARFELKFVRKDGEERWCDVSIGPVVYKGRMSGVITALDITERKKSDLALKESEEKFRVLAELSPTAIFMYQGTRLVYANPTASQFTGFSQEEIVQKQFWEMVHPRYREMVRQYGLARQRGEPVPSQYEIQYISKSGETRWAQFTAGQIEYLGKPAGIVTAVDMTERKQGELALSEAKAHAELYVDLMGHDINNMNQASLGFLEIISDKLESTGSLSRADLQLIASAVESLKNSSSLINSVRKLQKEKRGGLKPILTDVNRMLAEVKEQFSAVPGRNVSITFSSDYHCTVQANELLKDVFVNIVGNAIKHSQGDITINIYLKPAAELEQLFCRVEIEDNGPGISDEKKKAILQRSVQDRSKLTGKGLGLYLVRTLIDDYGGRIWVEDRVSGDYTRGCRFVILLPVSNSTVEHTSNEAKA